jgi:hypothetical protein
VLEDVLSARASTPKPKATAVVNFMLIIENVTLSEREWQELMSSWTEQTRVVEG